MDEAIGVFGLYVEAELSSVEAKTRKESISKQQQILGRILDLPDEKRFKKMTRPK